jgi:putative N-acetyltransferase (TIGR04045 family)
MSGGGRMTPGDRVTESRLAPVCWSAPANQVGPALGEVLAGRAPTRPAFTIEPARVRSELAGYHALRRAAFVEEHGLFTGHDHDRRDEDPRLVVLLARDRDGTLLGGVRLGPATDQDIGWWFGGRLVVSPAGRRAGGVGAALVRAACAHAESAGVLRFEAEVREAATRFFTRLGWTTVRSCSVGGQPHAVMRAPIGRLAAAARVKTPLGSLLRGLHLGGAGFVGDDGAPVPGSDLVAACDAVLPSMVERDPAWAGWCSVLVNVNDLAAMGAEPVGLLDAVAGPDEPAVSAVLAGLRAAAEAYGVPVLGGHTQLGVPSALSVTALGRTAHPVPGGGGRPGHRVRLTADLGGGWRPGYTGRQWDSTSIRRTPELRAMLGSVGSMTGRARPAAAKDVSMAGLAGTLGMLAEASGCGAVLDVAAVPRPAEAGVGDWLSCFPGFAMITAEVPGAPAPSAGPASSAECGELVEGGGVRLRWPDGQLTEAVPARVTGMGSA